VPGCYGSHCPGVGRKPRIGCANGGHPCRVAEAVHTRPGGATPGPCGGAEGTCARPGTSSATPGPSDSAEGTCIRPGIGSARRCAGAKGRTEAGPLLLCTPGPAGPVYAPYRQGRKEGGVCSGKIAASAL
jgi:hypothetical protein